MIQFQAKRRLENGAFSSSLKRLLEFETLKIFYSCYRNANLSQTQFIKKLIKSNLPYFLKDLLEILRGRLLIAAVQKKKCSKTLFSATYLLPQFSRRLTCIFFVTKLLNNSRVLQVVSEKQ